MVNTAAPFSLLDEIFEDFASDLFPSTRPLLMAIPAKKSTKSSNGSSSLVTAPIRMDVTESENGYLVHAELPGIPKESVKLNLENRVLTIEAETSGTSEQGKEGERYHVRERHWGKFKRSMRLPEDLDENNVKAQFENGVLSISLGKSQNERRKTIAIE